MNNGTYTLITGASRGIGKELALVAAKDGRNVVLVARSEATIHELASELSRLYGISALTYTADLSEPGAPGQLCDWLSRHGVVVDVLINNAGIGDYGPFVESQRGRQLTMIDLNVRALTELTRLLVPDMVQRRHGYIMNVSSVAGFLPGPLMSVYFATKAYVLSFSEALAEELRGTGVSVTCLCPGSTKSGFGEAANADEHHSTRTSGVTAEQVARYGWQAMLNRRVVAVHRLPNRLIGWSVRFLPRGVVARLVHSYQT